MLQVRPQQCRAERDNPFPHSDANTMLSAPKGTVGLPGCLGTLLTHIPFGVDQDPQSLSVGLLSSVPFPSQCVRPGLPLPRCRIRHLFLLYFMWLVHNQFSNFSTPLCKSSPPSMEETVPPNLMSLANVLKTSSSPVWQIIDENHIEKWPSNGALGNPASDQPPA